MKLLKKTKTIHTSETYSIDGSDLKLLKSYVNGKLKSVSFIGEGPHKSYPVLVKKSFKEFIKKQNPFHNYKEAASHYEKMVGDLDYDKAFKDGLIYFFYNSGHILFDSKGKPVPLPVTFDYIGTDFHSNALDIVKAKAVLSKHPWVLNKKELEIIPVPYYNSDGHNHFYLSVRILPDEKTYTKMYKMSMNGGRKEFFSVELKDLMIGKSYINKKWDPLKLHKLRIKNKE